MAKGEHPKSPLTAWERWELASFDGAASDTTVKAAPGVASAVPPAPTLSPLVSEEELGRIREQARLEGHAAGFATGKTAGLAAGEKAGQAAAEAEGRKEVLRLTQVLETLEQRIEELNQTVADELLALAIEVARQVVRHEVAAKPELLLGVVREALEQLPLLHAVIHLNPEDAALIRLRAGDQLSHAGHRINEDTKLKRGDVLIEAGGSHLDATLATRWRRVVEALGQNAPWVDTGEK
jgi:flagellar assembly protein FliH